METEEMIRNLRRKAEKKGTDKGLAVARRLEELMNFKNYMTQYCDIGMVCACRDHRIWDGERREFNDIFLEAVRSEIHEDKYY